MFEFKGSRTVLEYYSRMTYCLSRLGHEIGVRLAPFVSESSSFLIKPLKIVVPVISFESKLQS
jgi:hypothetical protein